MGKTDSILKVPAKVRSMYKRQTKCSLVPFINVMWGNSLRKDDVVEPVTPRPETKKKRAKDA